MQAGNTQRKTGARRKAETKVRRVAPGTFKPDAPRPPETPHEDRRERDTPALVMVLAPLLGAGIWAAMLFLMLG
jgi:hypothetical protein